MQHSAFYRTRSQIVQVCKNYVKLSASCKISAEYSVHLSKLLKLTTTKYSILCRDSGGLIFELDGDCNLSALTIHLAFVLVDSQNHLNLWRIFPQHSFLSCFCRKLLIFSGRPRTHLEWRRFWYVFTSKHFTNSFRYYLGIS